MPQTVEHFGTVRYMGIGAGIVVLTKCDLVDEEWLMLVEEDVKSLVAGSFLQQAPVARVSSITGEGIDRLKETIEDKLTGTYPTKPTRDTSACPSTGCLP